MLIWTQLSTSQCFVRISRTWLFRSQRYLVKKEAKLKRVSFLKFNYSKLCNSKTNSIINFCPQWYGNISYANYVFINFHAIYLKAQCHFHFKHWMQIKIYSLLLPQFFVFKIFSNFPFIDFRRGNVSRVKTSKTEGFKFSRCWQHLRVWICNLDPQPFWAPVDWKVGLFEITFSRPVIGQLWLVTNPELWLVDIVARTPVFEGVIVYHVLLSTIFMTKK